MTERVEMCRDCGRSPAQIWGLCRPCLNDRGEPHPPEPREERNWREFNEDIEAMRHR